MASPFLPQVSCLKDIIFKYERGGGGCKGMKGVGGEERCKWMEGVGGRRGANGWREWGEGEGERVQDLALS